ncbi:MAG: hypothetical protein P8074_26140 [Anaerolineales bacterium]
MSLAVNVEYLDGLLWLLLMLGPLLILQRSLHREFQAVFLLITRRSDISLALFSLLFFPGVLLHESSHYVVARLVGVQTGRFSLLPRVVPATLGNGRQQRASRLQLGYVETAPTDWVRDALIGFAPLFTGGLFVAYAGVVQLGVAALWASLVEQGPGGLLDVLHQIYAHPDFWLWFYLIFTVSSTMMPSASDRRGWLPIILGIAVLLAATLIAGAGPWLWENAAPQLDRILQAVAMVFGISVAVHLVLLVPLWVVRKFLNRLTGLEVV